jgi:hypothetical protein
MRSLISFFSVFYLVCLLSCSDEANHLPNEKTDYRKAPLDMT